MSLPSIQAPNGTALVPIVSSPRALELICKKWQRWRYRPDAVVLEGPLAGGHLGFRFEELDLESNRLENLLPRVKDVAIRNGNFPVIVAGGIFDRNDILRFLSLGADGVQMGTRFLATDECSASASYKNAVVKAGQDDILVAERPGSPCGMPFRVIKQSPMFLSALKHRRNPKCDKGYVLFKDRDGSFSRCSARTSNEDSFCICNGLLSSAGYNPDSEEPLYTVGSNAWKLNEIVSVKSLMAELTGDLSS